MPTEKQIKYLAALLACFVPAFEIAVIIDKEIERRAAKVYVVYVCPHCGRITEFVLVRSN